MMHRAGRGQDDLAEKTASPGIERALRAVTVHGIVELPLASIDGPVAAWLDELIGRAERSGLVVTWTTRDDLLCVIDMEA